jgi:hypothetical protein
MTKVRNDELKSSGFNVAARFALTVVAEGEYSVAEEANGNGESIGIEEAGIQTAYNRDVGRL